QAPSLYYANARFYDPETARFTSQDSYLGQADDPPSLHRYFYANDNPTRYVDPTGHESVLPELQGKKPGEVADWRSETFAKDPSRYADALDAKERLYLEYFNQPIQEASKFTAVQVKEARSMFGDRKDALEAYANFKNRSEIISHYALSHPATVALLG